jgi:hypothetical protein
LHDECFNHHTICGCFSSSRSQDTGDVPRNIRGGPTKSDEEVTDPKSTGRKRAAVLYPIEEGMVCEWSKLKFAGGGKHPIIGCLGRPASDRHHGPNKDTLRNELGNVHRICDYCHNRWHAANDPDYDPEGPFTPHDPNTLATLEEIADNEIYWLTTKTKKVVD